MFEPKFKLVRPNNESDERKVATDNYEKAVNSRDASPAGVAAMKEAERAYGAVLLAEDRAASPERYRAP